MRKLSYKEMRDRRLCTVCGKDNPTPERAMCPECAKRTSENRKRNKKYFIKIGKCSVCGKNDAEPNGKLCLECLWKSRDAYRNKQKTDEDREKDKLEKRELKSKRIASGLCPRCGKRKSIRNGLCQQCRARLKNYRESTQEEFPRTLRVSEGICYICGKNPVMPGKGCCEPCYQVRLKTLPAMWAKQNNEYWKQLEYSRRMSIKQRYSQCAH